MTEEITEDELTNYVNEIAENYGVNISDVTYAVTYTTTGTIDIDIPEDATEEGMKIIFYFFSFHNIC